MSKRSKTKSDIVHAAAKLVSHHRYTVLGAAAAAVLYSIAFIPGCQITGTNPVTGKPSTAATIVTDTNARIGELESTLAAGKQTYELRVEEIQTNASRELKSAAFTLGRLQDDAKRDAEKLKQAAADSLAEIEQKQTMIRTVLGAVQSLVPGFAATPGGAALFNIGTTLLAGGLLGDNVRKNRVIRDLKEPGSATS